jgi:DUF1009 family protein
MERMLDKNIGIIAGKGTLPKQLIHTLLENNVKPYLVALTDITDKETTESVETIWCRVTAVGKIMSFFKQNNVKQLVLVGGMKRPSFASLVPDIQGLKLLNRLRKLKSAGDDKMLGTITKFLEENGFEILGVDEVVPELLPQKGAIGSIEPSKDNMDDINYGKHIAQEIGKLDIGQAVIVQNAVTLGVEGIEGTDELITRCGPLQFDGSGAILVKLKKPKQDRRIDLPSIGPKTIERLHEFKFKGVVIEAGNSLILDREETIKKANQLGIFIYGI